MIKHKMKVALLLHFKYLKLELARQLTFLIYRKQLILIRIEQ